MRRKLPDGSYIEVVEVVFHRNGIGGREFWAMRVRDVSRNLNLIATCDEEGNVQVLDPEDLTVTFRGHDFYGPAIRRALGRR